MPELGSETVQLVITSPPYYNLKKYGAHDHGKSYCEYLHDLQHVFKEVKRVMMPGRFVAIIIGTAISDQGIKPLNADIIMTMERLKFTFVKEIIWMKPKGTQGLWQRGVRHHNDHGETQIYFCKGDNLDEAKGYSRSMATWGDQVS